MKTSSQLLLTFLLNAVWQIALIAALASLGAWLLRRSSMRFQHWLWVAALCLSVLVPVVTVVSAFPQSPAAINEVTYERDLENPVSVRQIPTSFERTPANASFQLNGNLALFLFMTFGIVVLYRSFRLMQAWFVTRKVRRTAVPLEGDEAVEAIIRECAKRLNQDRKRVAAHKRVTVCSSATVAVPITIGFLRPVIIVPEALIREGDTDLLTSAIGHEFIHVARHDYVLNLFYELIFLPVSFHPAAALLRSRIKQTRELCCDELVAERILNAEVYARSLVALASSAPPLRRLSVSTTVGIADADILEARIMSLLKKPTLNRRWKKLSIVAVSLLLLVPSFAAAAFAMRFELAQDPGQQAKELERKKTEAAQFKEGKPFDPRFSAEMERKREVEMEMRALKQAALVRLSRITMDQAIQIATSQFPGKVLNCNLDADRWEEPGKLAKDGTVFYEVIIADEVVAGGITRVAVNAVDGTIIKSGKELPRKRSPQN